MDSVKFNPQATGPYYPGGTVITSGSTVNQPYSPNVIPVINDYERFSPPEDKKEEKEEYENEIRNIYLEELTKIAQRDDETYLRQRKYGSWVFIISVVMTMAGVGFSVSQFLIAFQTRDFSQLQTDIAIETAGKIALTSSSLGTIILVLSLVYFFFFLNFVYKPYSKKTDLFTHIKGARDLVD